MGSGPLPVLPNNPPTTVNVGDVAQHEIDPVNLGELFTHGVTLSGGFERFWLMAWTAIFKTIEVALGIVVDGMDRLLGLLADFFLAAQGQTSPGFYKLTAALITDLTGVDVNGDELFGDFQSRGRVAAMQAVGAKFVDVLTSEFAGVTQTDEGGVFT